MTKARQLADLISSGSIETAEITSLDAAKLTGSIADARIPNLATSKINSGTFADARISSSSVTQHVTSYTHPNHSGEVTSTADGATVITDNIVDEANLKVSNTPTNGYMLTAQSGNTGGLTWADAPSGGLVPLTQSDGSSYSDYAIVNGWMSDTYQNYQMDYYITPVNNNVDISMTLYDSNGNISSGNEYDFVNSGATSSNGSTQTLYQQSQNAFNLATNVHNDTARIGLSGRMIWLHPRDNNRRTHILHEFQKTDYGATVQHFSGVLAFKASNALTGFYMNASSGQLANWSIKCYGIVNS